MRPRGPGVCIALALAVAACSASPPRDTFGTAKPGSKGGRGQGAHASRLPKGESTAGGTTTGGGGGGGGQNEPPVVYPDDGQVGAMALSYLRASPARRIVVEIDYSSGRAPSQGALDHLRAVLERELDKPGGIGFRLDDQIRDTRDLWSIGDIRALESRARDHRSSGGTATLWLAYLSGELEGGPGVLGVAYEGSGAAIFPDQIDRATTAVINAVQIERAVVTHETGHLLGLVNIGYTSSVDHEDPSHPGHSSETTSVMYWQIDDISVASLLSGGPPDDFDRYDRGDLRMRRTS